MAETTLVTTDWLDVADDVRAATITAASTHAVMTVGSSAGYWHDYSYHPWYPFTARPIRLTLREVERLREAARKDHDLKAILQKFTAQIEVEMSLE